MQNITNLSKRAWCPHPRMGGLKDEVGAVDFHIVRRCRATVRDVIMIISSQARSIAKMPFSQTSQKGGGSS
jgi:hypothetical protein